MTFQVTDPLDALDFLDDSGSPTLYGNIRQSQNHRISVEVYSDDRMQPEFGNWEQLTQETLVSIAKILRNRITTSELEHFLKMKNFVFDDLPA